MPRPARPDLRALARDALAGLDAARIALTNLATALEGGVQCPVTGGSNVAAWRAAHRPGQPSRIASDRKLHALITARIHRFSFEEVIAEVRANFPPERQTSRSALHRWRRRNGKFFAASIAKS